MAWPPDRHERHHLEAIGDPAQRAELVVVDPVDGRQGRAEPETAHCEIGTAEDRLLHPFVSHMIHLPVQQLSMAHRADVHLLPKPFSTFTRHARLLKVIGELKAVAVQDERFFLRLLRVER